VSVNAQLGHTPDGMVATLDQAEAVAGYFAGRKVDALILCPLDFGDERSAAKVAERLRVPVLLYATREPLPRTNRAWGASLIRTGSGLALRKRIKLPCPRSGQDGPSITHRHEGHAAHRRA
jgi:L-fucose isomerase-like protein